MISLTLISFLWSRLFKMPWKKQKTKKSYDLKEPMSKFFFCQIRENINYLQWTCAKVKKKKRYYIHHLLNFLNYPMKFQLEWIKKKIPVKTVQHCCDLEIWSRSLKVVWIASIGNAQRPVSFDIYHIYGVWENPNVVKVLDKPRHLINKKKKKIIFLEYTPDLHKSYCASSI